MHLNIYFKNLLIVEKKSKSLFDSVGEFRHAVGIYLTYTLDKAVISKLTNYAKGGIIVLHDYQQGINLENNRKNGIICIPVRPPKALIQNCFHSKLILLKSKASARIIVSSANLTKESFSSEKEIAWQQDIDFNNGKDVEIYNDIINYLMILNDQIVIKNKIFQDTLEMIKVKTKAVKYNSLKFIFNDKEKSIYNHLSNFLVENKIKKVAKSIKVATPFVSENYELGDFEKLGPISIYLRNGSRIPKDLYKYEIFQPKTSKRNGFHSKIIVLEYQNFIIAFIGSANFTQQGFFQLTNSANQESGIIFKSSNKNLLNWFNALYWKPILNLADYKETINNEEYFPKGEFYAFAQKQENSIIVYLYNPLYTPEKDRVFQNKKEIHFEKIELDFFQTTQLKSSIDEDGNETISFNIKEEHVTISVFNAAEFENLLKSNGESLFSEFTGKYTTKFQELEDILKKESIKVSPENSKITITEPPLLEEYFYRIKHLSKILNGRKIYTDYTLELRKELEIDDAPTLYKALQLIKIFSDTDITGLLKPICEERINHIVSILNLNKDKFKLFYKKWL